MEIQDWLQSPRQDPSEYYQYHMGISYLAMYLHDRFWDPVFLESKGDPDPPANITVH